MTVPEDLHDCSPSTKLVWCVLDRLEGATRSELIDTTGLGEKTVRRALDDLAAHDRVAEAPVPSEPNRRQFYPSHL